VRQIPDRSEDMFVSNGVNGIRRMQTKVAVDTHARYPILSRRHLNPTVSFDLFRLRKSKVRPEKSGSEGDEKGDTVRNI